MSDGTRMYKRPDGGDNQPAAIFKRLIAECEELSHLREFEADVEFLIRTEVLQMQGRWIIGQVHMPKVQGMLKDFFLWMIEELFGRIPDFLMTLDGEYWEAASDHEKEILVFHEACHMGLKLDADGCPMIDEDSGKARWKLIGHDVEEFSNVVRRYGAHSPDIQGFIAALQEHEARAQS